MPFTLPNEADAISTGAGALQAEPDAGDFAILAAADATTGVVSGCAVTNHPAARSVDVAAGVICSAGVPLPVTAVSGLAIAAADPTSPRFDLVVASAAGVLSVIAGQAAAHPAFPLIPAGTVVLAAVLVGANVSVIAANAIVDKRVILTSIPSATVDARVFGSRGDGVYVVDGAINAGSAILVSASGPFLPQHVGMPICVANAGTAGHKKTTVLSFQSPNQVTLASAANSSVTNAAVVIGNDTTALTAGGAAFTLIQGMGGYYFARGYHVARNLIADFQRANANPPGTLLQGGHIFGDGPGVTFLVIGDDLGGNPLFNLLGRHNVDNVDRAGPFTVENLTIVTPGRAFKGDAFFLWQGRDWTFKNVEWLSILGSAAMFTASDRPKLRGCRADLCGNAATAAPAFGFLQSDEGGTIVGRCTDVELTDTAVTRSDDHGVYMESVKGISTKGLVIDGAGATRYPFYGKDLVNAELDVNLRNGPTSNMRLDSFGTSQGVRVRGTFDGAGTVGVEIFQANPNQVFGGVDIGGIFGADTPNAGGSVSCPLDGSVQISSDAVTFDTPGFPMPPRGTGRMVTLTTTPSVINCQLGNEWLIQAGAAAWVISTFLYPMDGMVLTLLVKNTSGGAITMTWPGNIEWIGGTAPTGPSLPADTKKNIWTLIYSSAAGKWRQAVAAAADVR